MKKTVLFLFILIGVFACKQSAKQSESQTNANEDTVVNKRFFSETSFWNTPIPENPEIDPKSEEWMRMLAQEPTKNNFVINKDSWTIPVYEVNDTTPRYKIEKHVLSNKEKQGWETTRETFGHGKEFEADLVPIPFNATPDKESDMHMALVDYKNRIAWDMWGLKKRPDGTWQSKTGMKYSLDGDGVFDPADFDIIDGESVHFHGPSRAPGVPAIAGLIMYDETVNGEINHKLAACSRFVAFREFVYPAIWTDGGQVGGIPEGAVIQLDPDLDLSQFNLLPGELAIAKAAQKYGIVLVDFGGGQALYAEGLWGHPGKSWDGIIRFTEGFNDIPYKHFRVLKLNNVIPKGDSKKKGWDVLKF